MVGKVWKFTLFPLFFSSLFWEGSEKHLFPGTLHIANKSPTNSFFSSEGGPHSFLSYLFVVDSFQHFTTEMGDFVNIINNSKDP